MLKSIRIKSFIIFVLYLSFGCTEQKIEHIEKTVVPKDSIVQIKISAVGDIMCHSTQYNYAWVEKDSFDFNPVFKYVKDYFNNSDLVLGNLETVFAGYENMYSGYPFFNTPDELLDALKNSGFNLLFTSNNHALDKGKFGVIRTIKEIKKRGMINLGTNLSPKERDSIRIVNVKGVKIAILAYSYGTNGISLRDKYLLNLIDTTRIKRDLNKLKNIDYDFNIVYFHFGKEYSLKPNKFQKRIVNFTVQHGGNIVLASHTHTPQPLQKFKLNNAKLDSGFAIYSMGNFISNQRWQNSDGGIILEFSILKNITKNSLSIKNINFIPFWLYKGKIKNNKEFIVLPLPSDSNYTAIYPFLSSNNIKDMRRTKRDLDSFMKKCSMDIKQKFIY